MLLLEKLDKVLKHVAAHAVADTGAGVAVEPDCLFDVLLEAGKEMVAFLKEARC